MESVSVVVPFDGAPDRARGWEWLQARWVALHPAWEVLTAPDPGEGGWSKGRAVNLGVAGATGEVLVIADADCATDVVALTNTVAAVEDSGGWGVPFGDVYRLSAEETTALIGRGSLVPTTRPLDRRFLDAERPPYKGKPGGGIVVLTRQAFDAVGGMDERFVCWGGEDFAFAHALRTCIGRPHREAAPLWHLWHPPQPGYDPSGRMPEANRKLLARYRGAMRDPGTMRALLAERNGGEPMGCGCGNTSEPLPRNEAKCLTCGRAFTSYEGEDGALAHKNGSGHIIEGLRTLRALSRRAQATSSDPFVAEPKIEPKQATRPEELDPAAMSARP